MKIYDEITKEEITSEIDTSKGYTYNGKVVSGHVDEKSVIMEGSVSELWPDGMTEIIPGYDVYEDCLYYHAYTEKELKAIQDEKDRLSKEETDRLAAEEAEEKRRKEAEKAAKKELIRKMQEQDQEDESEELLNHIVLEELVDGLEDTERTIIRMRYYENKTQTEIAKEVGISQVQVSRLEKKILKKMREAYQR